MKFLERIFRWAIELIDGPESVDVSRREISPPPSWLNHPDPEVRAQRRALMPMHPWDGSDC